MPKKNIADAANTLVPALLALERLGFEVSMDESSPANIVVAKRGDETYSATDPLRVLGLVKLVEIKSWDWNASDADIEAITRKYNLV